MNGVLEAPEVVLDESILDETLECHGGHEYCSVDATHVITWCQPKDFFMCDGFVFLHLPKGYRDGARCSGCKHPIGDCWKARPV